jgi:hypothetical protein
MSELRLYSRPDCHLCDEAAALVRAYDSCIVIEQVNIEDNLDHLRRYGIRIPVLQRKDTGTELPWPFGRDELAVFLD